MTLQIIRAFKELQCTPALGDGSVEFQKNGTISEPLMEKSLHGAGEQIKSLWRFAKIQLSR